MDLEKRRCGFSSIGALLEVLNYHNDSEKQAGETNGHARPAAIDVCSTPWEPFGSDHTHPRLRVAFTSLPTGFLGKGTNGIVFAVVIGQPVDAGGRLCYTPAAMKVTTTTYMHLRETCTALQLNELVSAGATPSIMRLIDAFTATTLREGCTHPPSAWSDFWERCNRHWYDRRSAIEAVAGRGAFQLDERNRTGQLKSSVPLGVLFTELAPDFNNRAKRFKYSHIVNAPLDRVSLQDSGQVGQRSALSDMYGGSPPDQPNGGAHAAKDALKYRMVGAVWQAVQVVHALASAQAVHGDLYETNFVSLPTASTRYPLCRLVSDQARERITVAMARHSRPDARFGYREDGLPSGTTEPGWRYYHVPFHTASEQSNRDDCVALSPAIPHLCLIDFGSTSFCHVPAGICPNQIRQMFNSRHLIRFPKNIISENPLKYDPFAIERTFGMDAPSPMPCMTCLNRPTTMIRTRPAEHINPYVGSGGSSKVDWVVYSSLSDVYSLAATVCSSILGFDVFGQRYPAECVRRPEFQGLHVLSQRNDRYSSSRPTQYHIVLPANSRYPALTMESKAHEKHVGFPPSFLREVQSYLPKKYDGGVHPWISYETPDEFAAAIVARVYAVGAPRNHENTFLSNCLTRTQLTASRYPKGWLYPTLYRILCSKFGLSGSESADFSTLMLDALSWDPADRPTAEHILRSSFFSSITASISAKRLVPTELWSANMFYNEWDKSPETDLPLSPHEVQIRSNSVRPGMALAVRDRVRSSMLPMARYQWRKAEQFLEVPVQSRRIERSGLLCPFVSYSFFFYNVAHHLDMSTGQPLMPHADDDGAQRQRRRRKKYERKLTGRFHSSESAARHRKTLVLRSRLVPSWCMRFSQKSATPGPDTRSLYEAIADSVRREPKKRPRED